MAPDPASDALAIKQLAERLLLHPHPEGPTSVEVFLRRLPDDLWGDIPLPAGSTLLGSVLRMRSGRPTLIEAVLDSDRKPGSILAACETDLTERGWRIYETPGPVHGGFAASRLAEGRILRAGDEGPILMIAATARDGASTDVRMRLDWDMPRQMSSGRDFGASSGAERMPLLRAPSNVRFEALGAGGSTGRWTSDARVFTDRTVADLEAHFAQQLAAAGWQRVAGDADDVVGWSSWQVPGEGNWRGLLLVLAAFRADERSLTMRIEQDRPEDGHGGSTRIVTAYQPD